MEGGGGREIPLRLGAVGSVGAGRHRDCAHATDGRLSWESYRGEADLQAGGRPDRIARDPVMSSSVPLTDAAVDDVSACGRGGRQNQALKRRKARSVGRVDDPGTWKPLSERG